MISIRQNLNIQPDGRHGQGRWIPLAMWDEAADDTLTLDALLRESKRVAVGTDAGGLDDLAAMAVLGETEDGRYLLWTRSGLAAKATSSEKRSTL